MNSLNKIIASWKLNVKKYFFKYRKGFFELFMISNSPQLMLQNIGSMPFVKHDTVNHKISTDNMFCTVKIFYQLLEDGLFLMISDGKYKKNVMDVMLYDETVPLEYYFLSFKTSTRTVNSASTLVNGTGFSFNTWSLCKPGGIKNVCHFKHAHEHFITIYFTQKWLDLYLKTCDEATVQFFKNFIASDNTFVMCPRQFEENAPDYLQLFNVFDVNIPASELNIEEFKDQTMNLIHEFSKGIQMQIAEENYFNLSNDTRIKIIQSEQILSTYFTKEFPGVEWLADQVGISVTGLKSGFKQIYGYSIFKYYRHQKMKIAQTVLAQNKDIKIKDLAEQMGYTNAAKFTAAFKDEIGALPSDIVG